MVSLGLQVLDLSMAMLVAAPPTVSGSDVDLPPETENVKWIVAGARFGLDLGALAAIGYGGYHLSPDPIARWGGAG